MGLKQQRQICEGNGVDSLAKSSVSHTRNPIFPITFPSPYKTQRLICKMNFNQFPDLFPLQAVDSFPMMVQEHPLQVLQDQQQPPSDKPAEDMTVFVSGSTFCVVPSLFEKVQGLNWYDVGGLPHLDDSPDLFEVILQFFLFGCLPSKYVVKQNKAKLLKMVTALRGAEELLTHVQQDGKSKKAKGPDFMKAKNSLFTQKSLRSSNIKIEAAPSTNSSKKSGKSFLSRLSKKSSDEIPPIVQSVTFDSSDAFSASQLASDTSTVSSGSASSNKENPKKRQKMVLPGWNKGPSARKITHEEWCASEYIV